MPKSCLSVRAVASRLPLRQEPIRPERASLPLHAMVMTVGHEDHGPTSVYDWSGASRGPAEWALLQATVEGQGRLDYEGRPFTILPGQAMLLTLPHSHRYWREGASRWRFLYLCLTGSEVVRTWRHIIARRGPVLELPPGDAVLGVMQQTLREGFAGRLSDPCASSQRAYELAMCLLAHAQRAEGGASDEREARVPHAVRAAIDFARRHYHERIGVEQLASAAGLSRFHFTRMFHEHTGQTPGEFLRFERLRAVTRLLQTTDLPLKAVAQRAGLPNAEYLSRVFRKAHGLSPRSYREATRR